MEMQLSLEYWFLYPANLLNVLIKIYIYILFLLCFACFWAITLPINSADLFSFVPLFLFSVECLRALVRFCFLCWDTRIMQSTARATSSVKFSALSVFTLVCNHRHCPPELLVSPNCDSMPIKCKRPICPSLNSWQPWLYFVSLWI